MDDEIDYIKMRDETIYNARNEPTQVRYVRFKIGAFGPFEERVPVDTFDADFAERVRKLRSTIAMLPK